MFEKSNLTLTTAAVVQFMVSLDLSVVNVGLPQIATALHFTPIGLTWVIHAYALTFGGLLLLGGKAADRYGRKHVLTLGLTVFGLASLAGGLAHTPAELVTARATQGLGAAALAPAALALLTATYPDGKPRIRAFGIWAAMNAAGGALGVLIGGILTEYAGWRWIMFISVPMAATALTLTRYGIPTDTPAAPTGRPDALGAILATTGMTVLVLGIVRTNPLIAATGVAALALFIHQQNRTDRDPLIRPGLLTNRAVAAANTYNLLVGAAMAASFYFASLYLQNVLGHGPALTGLMFLPFALAVAAGSITAIKLGYRLPPRTLLIIGGLTTAAGFLWFGRISPTGTYLTDVLGPCLLAGTGFGLCLGPVVSIATAGTGNRDTGTASALLNSSRQLGAALGLALLGTAAQHRTGPNPTPQNLNSGYGLGLTLAALLLLAATLIATLLLPRKMSQPAARVSP